MRTADTLRLLFLASLWGASFLFMRILSPVLGALWTTEFRVALAALALVGYLAFIRRSLLIGENWRHYLVIGIFNSAVPFPLFAFAALSIPAGYSAIMNATTPLWGALLAVAVFGERLTLRKLAGLLLGIVGVAFLVRLGPAELTFDTVLAVGACLSAALCYAIAGTYSKKKSGAVPAPLMATGSQLAAALLLLPFAAATPIKGPVTPLIIMVAAALALLCTALAYLLYFRLITDIGATKAMTVTFLIPMFAILWGFLLLHEPITLSMLGGCALVIAAMYLVVFQKKA
ncbi:MAG TPA: DMT family transporter [Burkholderiaceae bacterium]